MQSRSPNLQIQRHRDTQIKVVKDRHMSSKGTVYKEENEYALCKVSWIGQVKERQSASD